MLPQATVPLPSGVCDRTDSVEGDRQKKEEPNPTKKPPKINATVSEPAIHYTSTIDAVATINADTVVFLAYDKTWEKRLLHVFRIEDGLSLYEKRPTRLDDNPDMKCTSSVYDLLVKKFGDAPASIHVLIPRQCVAKNWVGTQVIRSPEMISFINDDFHKMSSKLPAVPFNISDRVIPPLPSDAPPGPRMLMLRSKRLDPTAPSPLVLDYRYQLINKHDAI
ncbi:hypothetical protein ANO11243_091010 [Dothideomycetidae sp. 11243]|nr:hypothetical protein ANO11243_091010 [fungal sp. No.11243]